MRFLGYALIVFSAAALSFDTYILFNSLAGARFAGLIDIWSHFDKLGVALFENQVIVTMSPDLWNFLILPIMKFPAALLFGLPGFAIIRSTRPEINARAPSALEMEMMGQGMDSRQIREMKRRGLV